TKAAAKIVRVMKEPRGGGGWRGVRQETGTGDRWRDRSPASRNRSGEHRRDDLAAIDDLDRPVARSHQLLVGLDAQTVINGGGPVFDAQRIVFGLAGGRVRRAVYDPALQTAASHRNAEHLRPVVAAGVVVDL